MGRGQNLTTLTAAGPALDRGVQAGADGEPAHLLGDVCFPFSREVSGLALLGPGSARLTSEETAKLYSKVSVAATREE